MKNKDKHISHDLLMSYLLGEANSKQLGIVEEWLQLSEDNRESLDKLDKLWIETAKISPPPVAVNVDTAWVKMDRKIGKRDEEKTRLTKFPERKLNALKTVYRIAAVFILAIGVYTILRIIVKEPKQIILASTSETVRDTLPDGSQIALNSSYPKDKLYADSPMITQECRECENWREKDIIYVKIGRASCRERV